MIELWDDADVPNEPPSAYAEARPDYSRPHHLSGDLIIHFLNGSFTVLQRMPGKWVVLKRNDTFLAALFWLKTLIGQECWQDSC